MYELVILIPFFIIGLIIFVMVDLKQPHKSTTPTLEKLMEDVQEEAIKEIRSKLIEHYGNEKLIEKKLNSYDTLLEEMARIERNLPYVK